MSGQPQRQPLLISSILRHAARQHPDGEVIRFLTPNRVQRSSYAAMERRARQLLRVLPRLGVLPGDRVATLALSGCEHLEIAFAATGMGAVFHALDPALPDDDLAAALDQGDDCVLFADVAFANLAATLIPRVRHSVRRLVVICGEAELPMVHLPVAVSLHCYEPLLAADAPQEAWPDFAEDVPAVLSLTAGVTGQRRAVRRTHRDIVLHALLANQPDGLGLRATSRVVCCAELHQSSAWGVPFAAAMSGAALLLPGWPGDGAGLAGLIATQHATCLVAPPAALAGLARHIAPRGPPAASTAPLLPHHLPWAAELPALRRVVIGGAALPGDLLTSFAGAGIDVQQGWGLTEAGAGLTSTAPSGTTVELTGAAARSYEASQGRALFGTELKLADADGVELPWDGLASGELHVRGPAVTPNLAARGARDAAADGWVATGWVAEGWVATGDIARIDPHGYVHLLDRVSDLIRSGGAWISGTALEAAALAHADVAEAACVAARHPKWTERPVLLVVAWPGRTLDLAALQKHLRASLPHWSVPDALVLLPALPRTAAGRVDKLALRRQYADYLGQLSTRA